MNESMFITGCSGLLGSNLCYLLRGRYSISGIDRNEMHMEDVETICGSVLDFSSLESIIMARKPDIVLHCAALTRLDECEQHPEEAYLSNTELTRRVAEISEKIGAKMIFISSDAVFPGTLRRLAREDDAIAPISVYGKSKALAEEIVLRIPRSLVIRTNIYGYNRRDKSSFGEWVYLTLRDGHELNMFDDVFFSPILVNDLTEIFERCIQEDLSGLYHICSTGSISKYDMGMCIKETFSLPGLIHRCSMEGFQFIAPRTHNMGMDNAKIKQTLQIEIRTPEESVAEFMRLMASGYPGELKNAR